MKGIVYSILLWAAFQTVTATAQKASSPNGKVSTQVVDKKLVVCYDKQQVLELADVPFNELKNVGKVKDDYQMLSGKRLHCTNKAREYQALIGPDAKMVMRLYNDGIAFRYE